MHARILQFFRSAISVLPTLAVLSVLAVLAMVGHMTEWKISEAAKFWKIGESADQLAEKKQDHGKQSAGETLGLRFASVEAMEKSGIKTALVTKRPMSQSVVANGIIE